ncbi:hypothetical protein JOH51_005750 [Rhizobium leguminosarum]|nr:hypothetical protein [Rhizobium leguminosarum]
MNFVTATFEPNKLRCLDGLRQQFAVLNRIYRLSRSVYDKQGRGRFSQFSLQGLAAPQHEMIGGTDEAFRPPDVPFDKGARKPFVIRVRRTGDHLGNRIEALIVAASVDMASDSSRVDGFWSVAKRAGQASIGRVEVLAGAALLQALLEIGDYAQIIEVGPAIFARTVEFG